METKAPTTPADAGPGGPADMAVEPLLESKIALPLVRGDVVPRPQLTAALDEAAASPVVLVAAPTGFGKTTLLSVWARESSLPVVWVTLDPGDNDPVRFWSYVAAALDRLRPGAGAEALILLRSPQPAPAKWVVTALLNALAALPGRAALVLDDCHLVSEPAVYEALAFLIDNMPPALTLVLAGRSDPPLPLARLRARRRLAELRADRLRFSADEVARLLEPMGFRLSEADLLRLTARTEGWIASLHLAALSLQGQPDPERFIEVMNGSNRFIMDYLVEEVLAQQPPTVQEFLLHTAVLDRMSAELCEAVGAGWLREPAQQTIEALERANLFVIPLDTARAWYRYHHVFAEFLRARLQRAHPERARELHRRAAAWFEAQGLALDAVGHALAAGDSALAARLIERAADGLVQRGELSTLRAWIDALPEGLVRASPQICMVRAWTAALSFEAGAAEEWVRRAEGAGGAEAIRSEAALLRALVAATQGSIPEARAQIGAVLGGLDGERQQVRRAAQWIGELVSLISGEASLPKDWAGAPRREGAREELPFIQLRAAFGQATRLRLQGQLREAAVVYEQALAHGAGADRPLRVLSLAQIGLAAVRCEQRALGQALDLGLAGVAAAEEWKNDVATAMGRVTLGQVREAQGDLPGALAELDAAAAVAEGIAPRGRTWLIVGNQRARMRLAAGDLEAARAWAAELRAADLSAPVFQPVARYSAELTLARVALADGDLAEARRALDSTDRAVAEGGWLGLQIEALLIRARLLAAEGDRAGAAELVARARALGEPEGYAQVFEREGPALRLLADGQAAPPARRPATLGPLADGVEPLSPREAEVVRLLAAGYSNQRIADALVVSVGTVKTHLIHIYGKLGVHTREEAAERAASLGMI